MSKSVWYEKGSEAIVMAQMHHEGGTSLPPAHTFTQGNQECVYENVPPRARTASDERFTGAEGGVSEFATERVNHPEQRSPIERMNVHEYKPFYNQENLDNSRHNYTDRVPHLHPQPVEAWGSSYPERPVTPTGQRKSLDETYNRQLHQGINIPPLSGHFQRQHRRGRSDEVSRCFEGTPDAQHPTRFGSPPSHYRTNFPPPFLMHLSRSTTSLDDNRPSIDHHPSIDIRQDAPYGQMIHPLHHSTSVDTGMFNPYSNETLYRQNSAYVNLVTAISLSQKKFKDLEKDNEQWERELNKLLAIQKNPTEKEYRHLKEEVSILHREISEMYGECDKLGISTNPSIDPLPPMPLQPLLHTPSPTKPPSGGGRYIDHVPPFQYPGRLNVPDPGKDQPPPSYTSLGPKSPPPPLYNNVNSYDENSITPNLFRTQSQQEMAAIAASRPLLHPPTRPPRPPKPRPFDEAEAENDNEHWECPSCTFKNLLVAECEVCYTPRPIDNRLRHS